MAEEDDSHDNSQALVDEYLSGGDGITPLIDQAALPEGHRSGFVVVVGKPNVGKSTLMNCLLGEKLAIVSPKPQTTRTNQLGILTRPDVQVVFTDTPGIHLARNKLGEYMVEVAAEAIPDSDVILFIVDVSTPPARPDEIIAEMVREKSDAYTILALNKSDLLEPDSREELLALYRELVPVAVPMLISAEYADNTDNLLDMIVAHLPEGPRYFPSDQLSDMQVRESAAEAIREQVLALYQQEIPHSVAVEINQFKERERNLTYISATIYVERETQKRIIIGKKGSALRELGKQARLSLEEMLNTRVYLELWVKVLKNWRKDPTALGRLGYTKRGKKGAE
nr:GTPase Era [Anaerolineae bacterium]